jgi:hypothetical protein
MSQPNPDRFDPNRLYDVRLVRFDHAPTGQVPYTPGSLTVQIAGTSSHQARNAAQASYPGYTVVDVMERRC